MRARVYFKHVSPNIIYSRGRGFEAYVRFTKEASKDAHTNSGELVATCVGSKLYLANTMIQIA